MSLVIRTYDVEIEFVNGEKTWVTFQATSGAHAEQRAEDEYGVNVHRAVAHPHGTRPGFKRQGR